MRTLKHRVACVRLAEEQQRKERKLNQLFEQMEENMRPEDYKDCLEQLLRIIRLFPPEQHEELIDALLAVKTTEADVTAYFARRRMEVR